MRQSGWSGTEEKNAKRIVQGKKKVDASGGTLDSITDGSGNQWKLAVHHFIKMSEILHHLVFPCRLLHREDRCVNTS